MQRVALVAPVGTLRAAMARVADAGGVDLDRWPAEQEAAPGEAGRRLQGTRPPGAGTVAPALSPSAPDLDACERQGRWDLIAGEAELEQRSRAALVRGSAAALAGWAVADAVPGLAGRLAEVGGAVVALPAPAAATRPRCCAPRGSVAR
jgi:V/A-type H+-transporting ATPase subunit I